MWVVAVGVFLVEARRLGYNVMGQDIAPFMIEHHPDPKRLLRKMHDLLKPGGLAAVSTHDVGNWFAGSMARSGATCTFSI